MGIFDLSTIGDVVLVFFIGVALALLAALVMATVVQFDTRRKWKRFVEREWKD